MLASEQRYLAEIILTQLTIKVPNFGPKNSNFACKSQIFRISFQKMLRSLGLSLDLDTFAKFLRVLVSEKFSLGKKSRFRFWEIWSRKKSLGIGFGQIFGIVIQWAKGGIYGIPWDHQVGLMSLQMIHEAYKPVYM